MLFFIIGLLKKGFSVTTRVMRYDDEMKERRWIYIGGFGFFSLFWKLVNGQLNSLLTRMRWGRAKRGR